MKLIFNNGVRFLINSLRLKDKNIITFLEGNRVTVKILSDSDLSVAFCLLKNLVNKTELIPESIYILKNDFIKIKKSLNKFKNLNFWDFLDIKDEIDETLVFKSENFEWDEIIGWEVRYKILPYEKDLNEIIDQSLRDWGELISNFKKKKW